MMRIAIVRWAAACAGLAGAALASAPVHAQTALSAAEARGVITGPCAATRAIAARVDFSLVGLSWPDKAARFEAELAEDMTFAELDKRIAASEHSIKYYYDDFAGKLDDYQLCLRKNKRAIAQSRKRTPAPAPVPISRVAASSGGGSSFTVLPPTITPARKEQAFTALAATALGALTGKGGVPVTGNRRLDLVIAAVSTSLRGENADLLGGHGELLNVILGEVRSSLAGKLPASNQQLVDLVTGEVRRALAKPRAAPKPKLAAPAAASNGGRSGGGANGLYAPVITSAFADLGIALTPDSSTDAIQKFKVPGNYYTVQLLGCKAGVQCTVILLEACWSGLPNGTSERANTWNNTKAFGRMYLNGSGLVCLDSGFPVPSGTFDPQSFKEFVSTYTGVRETALGFLKQ